MAPSMLMHPSLSLIHIYETALHKRCYHLSEQLFLQSVLDQQVPEPAKGIPVRNLVAGIDAAELRKCAAVDGFCHSSFVTQVIEV